MPSAVVPATAPPAEHSEPVPLAENVQTEAGHDTAHESTLAESKSEQPPEQAADSGVEQNAPEENTKPPQAASSETSAGPAVAARPAKMQKIEPVPKIKHEHKVQVKLEKPVPMEVEKPVPKTPETPSPKNVARPYLRVQHLPFTYSIYDNH